MGIRIFVSINIFLLVLLTNSVQAREYNVGKTFETLFHIDFPGGKRIIPLPPGKWQLAKTFRNLSSGGDDLTKLVESWLIRINAGNLTGLVIIKVPKDIVDTYWGASGICEHQKYKDRSNLVDGFGERMENGEDCLVLGWIRGWRKSHRKIKPMAAYLSSKDIEWSEIPNGWIRTIYRYAEDDNFLSYRIYLPPEHYNFKRERKYSYSDSPWMPNKIDQHSKKKKFVKGAISWAKSWKNLVKKGFEHNSLSEQEVLNHPKIDGSMAIAVPAKKVSIPKVTAPAGDMATKLKKLKKLYEAELISEDRVQREEESHP